MHRPFLGAYDCFGGDFGRFIAALWRFGAVVWTDSAQFGDFLDVRVRMSQCLKDAEPKVWVWGNLQGAAAV